MSLFGTILEKLGLAKPAAKAAPPPGPVKLDMPGKPPAPAELSKAPTDIPKGPSGLPVVDVVAKLEGLAKANPQKLDWKVSIVDLLKLLGIDSSFNARKELATELGCPANLMGDSAQMNTWLHKTVMKKLAENGGNIPKELLS